MTNKEKVKNLKLLVNDLIDNNEYNMVQIKDVYLTRADLDTLDFFCDILLEKNTLKGYMVLGEIKEVLNKYNINY